MKQDMEIRSVSAIRVLAADTVQKANSGHPGLPLGAAAVAYELFAHHMKHNPGNPVWEDRDRFILSGGHGSALEYALLHLFGYGLTAEDLAHFRQLDSRTPGHPEYGHTVGVEATTGPLGAGMGMAVGMAMAEAHLSAVFNRPEFPIVDHYTYVLGGDGCMMEGISSEAFSLAGTLGLSKLIVLYDSNRISIEGSTDIAFTENVQQRMEAFGFQILTVEDGNDLQTIGKALEEARADQERPSFITIKTVIGYGCPNKQGQACAHGEPLGEANVAALRETLGWEWKEPFFVPEEIYEHYRKLSMQGTAAEDQWNRLFDAYGKAYPELLQKWNAYHDRDIAQKLYEDEAFWSCEEKPQSTRNLSGIMINRLKTVMPGLIGGSADLSPSTKTYMSGEGDFSKTDYTGRNLHFGVRELAMAAIGNGLALHGLRPFVSTFFVFSDYTKPMARLSALMGLPVTYVFTHDSIGVGEDGPTHEPVEQLAMLRAMPNFNVFRPADARETAAAWYYAATATSAPTALVLSRQELLQLAGSGKEALKGGYVLKDAEKSIPDAILMASGSEVSLALEAAELLQKEGIDVRVVSMPSMDVFEQQRAEYREEVLPKSVRRRVAIEALSGFGWGKYVGLDGAYVTMPGFGASAPAELLFQKFGFTAQNVAETVKTLMISVGD
ncbi:MAG: transketolase [Lachnospiraceae bacterium]|nr:transketolase [Lachnospiraceae bacterium]